MSFAQTEWPAHADPFGASADPARYVARPATEAALDLLIRAVEDQRRPVVLLGPPGIGKTLLLRLLAQRLAPNLECIHLPYASLPAAALCAWALDRVGGTTSYDPVGALATHARRLHTEGRAVVLIADGAEAMPDETAHDLGRAAQASRGSLRLVVASLEQTPARFDAAWGEPVLVRLAQPMTRDETQEYLRAHLASAGLTEPVGDAFDAAAVDAIFTASGGSPALVNREAAQRLLRRFALHAPPRRRLPAAAPTAAPPPSALPPPVERFDEEAAFERAAGRLALAHGHIPGGETQEPPVFERAVGRLALAEAERLPPPADPAPRRPSRPVPADAPPVRRVRTPSVAGWLRSRAGLLGVCVIAGVGIGAGVVASSDRILATLAMLRGDPVSPERIIDTLAPVERAPQPERPPAPPSVPQPVAPREAPAAIRVEGAGGTLAGDGTAAPLVKIQINATPWAVIRIDGEDVGVTPLAGVMLEAGTHRFEARFPNGAVEERSIEVDEIRRFVAFKQAEGSD